MNKNISKGQQGEALACQFIEKKGYKILDKNWRYSTHGELDIIALDKKTLVFIEVKTRTSNNYGHPIEAITLKKMNTIKSLASAYLNEKKDFKFSNIRFDAVGIILGKEPDIKHYIDIYQF